MRSLGDTVFDGPLQLPLLILKESALQNNLREMRDFCEQHDVELAPHCKTHMSPELWRMQAESGAVTATVATVAQAQALFDHGVKSIMIANEVVDRAGLMAITEMHRSADIRILVDSVEAVTVIDSCLSRIPANLDPLPVLIELGVQGHRAGVRVLDDLLEVAMAISKSPFLTLVGLEGYEGVLGTLPQQEREKGLHDYLDSGVAAVRALIARGLVQVPAVVTFGGSRYYPAVVSRVREELDPAEAVVVLRSGCYLTHDHGSYAASHAEPSVIRKPLLTPAIEVWGVVLSLPEPGLAIVGVGKRDVSHDDGLPVPLIFRRAEAGTAPQYIDAVGATVFRMSDQHTFVRIPADAGFELGVGDLMAFGVSHPCTTFDKWRTAQIVDDRYRLCDTAHTIFH